MEFDRSKAMADIEAAIAYESDLTGNPGRVDEANRLHAAICRYAPPGTTHRAQADKYLNHPTNSGSYFGNQLLEGVATALLADIAAGHLDSFEELIRGDLFASLLEQAGELVSGHYRLAAAVLAGASLEEHVRGLARRHGIAMEDARGAPQKAAMLNDALKQAGVYGKIWWANVAAWQRTRNAAAHGDADFASQSDDDIRRMIEGIREFIAKFPR
jgi:hypothetical protein